MQRYRSTSLPPAALLALTAVMAVGSLSDLYVVSADRSLATSRLSRSSQRQAKQWLAKLAETAVASRSMRPSWHVTHLTFAAVGSANLPDAGLTCFQPTDFARSLTPVRHVEPRLTNLPPPTTA